ncbi:MAG: hypothetical protein CMI54_07905 [Parcubacteria group bacterium]|nr:hypothetical protein [Parcubacteria group bacterium]
MHKLIIFDFDGPILDSFGTAKKAVLKTRDKLIKDGLVLVDKLPEPNEKTFILNWGYPGPIGIKRMFPLFDEKEVEIFGKTWMILQKQDEIPLIKGVNKILQELKRKNLTTALITARSHDLKYYLRKEGLINFLDFVQSWGNPEMKNQEAIHENHVFHQAFKPNPEVFDKILKWAEKKKIKKEEILLIDDTLVGTKAAKSIGINFIGVCTGPISSKENWQEYGRVSPDYVLESISELPKWLEKRERV